MLFFGLFSFQHHPQLPHTGAKNCCRYLWLYKDVIPQLKNHFVFHDRLIEHVKNFKRKIQGEISTNVLFVGVHCRRTDFLRLLKMPSSNSTYVTHHYFDKAFDVYREKFNSKNVKVIFLAVSDDTKWIKVHFL